MNPKDILGKKLKITFRDIGSNFYSQVELYVSAVSVITSHSTTETIVALSSEGVPKAPPYILLGNKGDTDSTPKVFLPWVRTKNPNDAFVDCRIEILFSTE